MFWTSLEILLNNTNLTESNRKTETYQSSLEVPNKAE